MLDCADGGRHVGCAGHEEHRQIEIVLAYRAQQIESVHRRHGDVAHHDVELLRLQLFDGPPAIRCGLHLVACFEEDSLDDAAKRFVVIDDEHAPVDAHRSLG